jgi:hypothetical protein
MNKLLAVVVSSLVFWANSALAQQAQDGAAPVEFFACDYQDGKGLSDLKEVAQQFKAWADKNDSKYSAWILTPQFANDLDFQVGWLGSWPDGKAFGASQDNWMAGGQDMAKEFGKVIDCSNEHQLVTSAVVNAPDGPPGNGIVWFSACTMQDGVSPVKALPAHRKSAKIMTDMGSKARSWLFWPGIGAGDIDFHYWRVVAFENYSEMGAATELYFNGGAWKQMMEIMAPVARCESGALFDAHLVRQGPAN